MLHTYLKLERPLAVFDCESTGRYPDRDRIVELTILTIAPDGAEMSFTSLVDPTVPIPAEATEVHGINDDMVHGSPTFAQLAPTVVRILEGADLAGYNARRFDVPLLLAEFKRLPGARRFSMDGRRVIDPCAIFFKREPRDLEAALRFFCGRALEGAHRAGADVAATVDVLVGQFSRYGDLPRTVDELHAYCKDPSWIDDAGKVVWNAGVASLSFGQHAGRSLVSMLAEPQGRDYLRWILTKDFQDDTKAIITAALDGQLPALAVRVDAKTTCAQ